MKASASRAAKGVIFESFTQADDTITRRFGGTGLGLAICRQLVEMMGGRIDVDLTEGEGSCFWFEIPLSERSRRSCGGRRRRCAGRRKNRSFERQRPAGRDGPAARGGRP